MKFLTYKYKMFGPFAGVLQDNRVIDLTTLLKSAQPLRDIRDFLEKYDNPKASTQQALATQDNIQSIPLEDVELCAPILQPPTIRDASIFERHVVNAGKNNGVGTPASWYKEALFYFQNTNVISGPEAVITRKRGSTTLDYEAEVALVIGKGGRDIAEENALEHIFGLTIYNDWSDRDMCSAEVGFLGLHKGKDFANGIGPWIVTMDEFMDVYKNGKLELKVNAWVNGKQTTDSMTDDMYWTLPYLIARISEDADIAAGDIIGLGTVGTGCIYERPNELPYLSNGDVVEIEVDRIGKLRQYVNK